MSGAIVVVYGSLSEFHDWQDENADLAPLVIGVDVYAAYRHHGLRVLDFIVLPLARRHGDIESIREHLERSKRGIRAEERLRHLLDVKYDYERTHPAGHDYPRYARAK